MTDPMELVELFPHTSRAIRRLRIDLAYLMVQFALNVIAPASFKGVAVGNLRANPDRSER